MKIRYGYISGKRRVRHVIKRQAGGYSWCGQFMAYAASADDGLSVCGGCRDAVQAAADEVNGILREIGPPPGEYAPDGSGIF